ncbi:hypothetical protein K505DRAFT_233885 [Melanomma pulvis-pyrius CBS 109.77]|uniref:Uncharacterized protein n=1 Tax=Melanomma pulvis-pyrius CBS 109.77 TaxID=1314802 RepID=A0A6A6XPD7_9PLEO|nr:hypothetical protein K505DRAFT_233885 [Melanomma pulvis-pyrius CBS 109.77]
MDISATLTADEVASLSGSERTCEAATRWLEDADAASSPQHPRREGGSFEESLRLKNTLDIFEEQARTQPSWELLSILVNCEYKLYVLNQATPLRHNPFLSHWVETIQRLSKTIPQSGRLINDILRKGGSLSTSEINVVRIELLKSLLQFRSPSQFALVTPRQLYTNFVELQQSISFEIGPYIQMLEEEGIYERTPSPNQGQEVSRGPSAGTVQDTAPRRPKLSDFQQWKQEVLSRLESEPETAIQELTHLPIGLSSLDFLTTLLQDNMLERFSIDPAPVVSDYIQHALRLTEHMGRPPGTADSSFDGFSMPGTNGNVDEEVDHGREAQTRAVKLLLLFIRNLIRKALLPPEAIYFEIQEICVRYVWIKEVRDFRAFIEEGIHGEQASTQPV